MTAIDDATDLAMKTDALGFRRKKTAGTSDTWFIYDLGESQAPGLAPLVGEYNSSGTLAAKYHSGRAGILAMTREATFM